MTYFCDSSVVSGLKTYVRHVHLSNVVAPNRIQVLCRICLLQSINSTENVTVGVIQKFS